MESQLTCPQCLQHYKDDNLPRMLTMCGHTYCESCIDSCKTQQEGLTTFTCPEDNATLTVAQETVQTFPKNIALMKLIDSKRNTSMEFKDESINVSKITKGEEAQEDEDEKELMEAINASKDHKKDNSTTQSNRCESQGNVEVPDNLVIELGSKQRIPQEGITELCLLHQKPLEVVCTIDKIKICSKCAIFGEHKGHEFKGIEEILSKNKQYQAKIVGIFDRKNTIVDRITHVSTQKDLVDILKTKCGSIKKEIQERCRRFVEEINKQEILAVKKLDSITLATENKIKGLLQIEEPLMKQYNEWEENSLRRIEESEKGNFEGQLELFTKGDEILARGNYFEAEMNKHQTALLSQIDKCIADLGVVTNESILESVVNYLQVHQHMSECKERGQPKQQTDKLSDKSKPVLDVDFAWGLQSASQIHYKEDNHEHEESLLDLQFNEVAHKIELPLLKQNIGLSASRISRESRNQQTENRRENVLMPKLDSKKKMAITKDVFEKTNAKQASHCQSMLTERRDSAIGPAALKKKLKSIKVPEKYEKVLEGIVSDTHETIDLTGAELGDNAMLQVCELFKYNCKARTIKLIRNKLTDEVIPKLIPSLCNAVTLNLSQNALTETAVGMLADNRALLPCLRSVILSHNKIIERKHKVAIDRLRKMDLIVSV